MCWLCTCVSTNYTYDEQNRLTQSVTGNATTYYGYDNNGNLISEWNRNTEDTVTTGSVGLSVVGVNADEVASFYEYDVFDRLIKIEQGSDVIENAYTADGKKLSRTTNGEVTHYVYDGNVVIEEQNSDNDETARNVYGRNLITRETTDGLVVYAYNGHSDIVAICNVDVDTLVTYVYDEFGKVEKKKKTIFRHGQKEKSQKKMKMAKSLRNK